MICSICKEDKGLTVKIIPFNIDTLKKCTNILKIRQKFFLKFYDLNLPTSVDGKTGYHVKCYQNYTGIMKKYLVNEAETPPNRPWSSLQSSKLSVTQQATAEEVKCGEIKCELNISDEEFVMEISNEEQNNAECFFCGKQRKKYCEIEQKLYATSKVDFKYQIEIYKEAFHDNNIWERFQNLKTDKIFYHNVCKLTQINKYKSTENETPIMDSHHHYQRYNLVI